MLVHLGFGQQHNGTKSKDDPVFYILYKEKRKGLSVQQQLSALDKAYEKAVLLHNRSYQFLALDRKSYLLGYLGKYEDAMVVINRALNLGNQLKDTLGLLRVYKKQGEYYRKLDSVVPALIAYDREHILASQVHDTLTQIHALIFMSNLQNYIGLSYQSESSAIEGLQLLDQFSNNAVHNESRVRFYNQLGIIYKERQQYKEALYYYQSCLPLITKPKELNAVINNIGNIYFSKKQYGKALSNYETYYHDSSARQDSVQMGRGLINLGKVHLQLGDADAHSYLLKGLEIHRDLNRELGIYSSYLSLAEYYQYQQQFSKAQIYAYKAYALAKKLQLGNEQLESIELLMDLGQTKFNHLYIQFRDSLENRINYDGRKYIAYQYNYEKEHRIAQENEVKYLKSDLALQREREHAFWWRSITIIGLLITGFSFVMFRNYHRKREVKRINATEAHIAKKIHDEIANDIYHTMHKLQQPVFEQDAILESLDDIYQRTRNISKANSMVDVDTSFSDTLEELLTSYKSNELLLITRGLATIHWKAISKEKRTVIYRILQELMTNMRKHSHATSVLITFDQSRKQLRITYKDNGRGTDLTEKSGLLHTENRIRSVKGKITFESAIGEGFQAHIIL